MVAVSLQMWRNQLRKLFVVPRQQTKHHDDLQYQVSCSSVEPEFGRSGHQQAYVLSTGGRLQCTVCEETGLVRCPDCISAVG